MPMPHHEGGPSIHRELLEELRRSDHDDTARPHTALPTNVVVLKEANFVSFCSDS